MSTTGSTKRTQGRSTVPFTNILRVRGIANALLVAGFLALAAGAPPAWAASVSSSNWAGYVAHGSGVRFRAVSATWRESAPTCPSAFPSYSSTWVGLGGFRSASSALEQVGVELDCRFGGGSRAFAWYELVPAPSVRIGMAIQPGDTIRASVTVVGRQAALKLSDLTRHESFGRTVSAPAVDVTSADWIVEAPSACFRDNLCRTLPLADFGTIPFTGATATSAGRHHGSISSSRWSDTKITLLPSRFSYVVPGSAARAVPSSLSAGGSAFAVTSSAAGGASAPLLATAAAVGPPQPGGAEH